MPWLQVLLKGKKWRKAVLNHKKLKKKKNGAANGHYKKTQSGLMGCE